MLKTERLILRPWREEDLEPFARMNANAVVMEFFPSTLSREESDRFAQRITQHFIEKGWGLWAVSIPQIADFIGYVGILEVATYMPFAPAVEIGWRLDNRYWGQGYALEGAKAVLSFCFNVLHLNEVVSFTTVQNLRSRRVMERLGMTHNPQDDFRHPMLPPEDRLSAHVLYRMSKELYRERYHD